VYLVPESALPHGFSNEPAGTHGSRTIMLSELRQLIAATPRDATYDDYRRAIVDDNVLGKRTMATRKESLRRLRELYSLSPEVLLFRALRDLWDANPDAQPMLALLCASARDPILRASAEMILKLPRGTRVTPQMIEEATMSAFPGRYNPTMLANIGRHVASSWKQSGLLQGRVTKTRSRAVTHPESTAYALFLGRLCGAGGAALFSTLWCKLLDAPEATARDQSAAAARLGWIEHRSAGDVIEVGFSHLSRGTDVR
jgi:hypothetical protein